MRVTQFSMTVLFVVLLSGCVTRIVTVDDGSTATHGGAADTVLFVPVLVLPPDSNDDRNSPDSVPPGQSGREIRAQLIRVPGETRFAEPILFSTDKTKIHLIAVPLAGVQIKTVQH